MNIDFLRPLFDRPSPLVSIYPDATRTGENADHAIDRLLAQQGGGTASSAAKGIRP
jgi:hypothetical protein